MLAAYDAKLGNQQQVARMFGVTRQSLYNLLQQRANTDSILPRHGGGRRAAFTGKKLEQLHGLVRQQADATLAELRERTGVTCSLVAVHNALARLGLRLKKSRSTPPNKTGPM
jgi:transposase